MSRRQPVLEDPTVPDVPAYERDPTLTRLETSVVEVGTTEGRLFAVLADTVLYPEGGGQPADHGHIDDVVVTDVQQTGGLIRHVLGAPVEIGPVTVRLDWTRRVDHMQQHSAQC